MEAIKKQIKIELSVKELNWVEVVGTVKNEFDLDEEIFKEKLGIWVHDNKVKFNLAYSKEFDGKQLIDIYDELHHINVNEADGHYKHFENNVKRKQNE